MLESAWFENKNGTFTAHILPLDAQVSCTKRIVVHDFTRDGKPDLLLLGNDENNMPKPARMTPLPAFYSPPTGTAAGNGCPTGSMVCGPAANCATPCCCARGWKAAFY